MKVRRKSEIAEAVQWDGTEQKIFGVKFSPIIAPFASVGDWIVNWKDAPRGILIYSPEEFAAHYEPVPEPPACNHLFGNDGSCQKANCGYVDELLRPRWRA